MGEGRLRGRLLFVKPPRQPRLHRLRGGELGGERRDARLGVAAAAHRLHRLRQYRDLHPALVEDRVEPRQLRRRRLRLGARAARLLLQLIAPRVRLRRRRRRRALGGAELGLGVGARG